MKNKYLPNLMGLAWHKQTQSLINLCDTPIHKSEFLRVNSSLKTRSWSNVGTLQQHEEHEKLYQECLLHGNPCEYVFEAEYEFTGKRF